MAAIKRQEGRFGGKFNFVESEKKFGGKFRKCVGKFLNKKYLEISWKIFIENIKRNLDKILVKIKDFPDFSRK